MMGFITSDMSLNLNWTIMGFWAWNKADLARKFKTSKGGGWSLWNWSLFYNLVMLYWISPANQWKTMRIIKWICSQEPVMKNFVSKTIFDLSLKVPPEMISYFLFYYLMSLSSWTSLKQAYKGKVFAKNFLCHTERKRYRKMP